MPEHKSPFEEHVKTYEQWFERNKAVYGSELRAVGHFVDTDSRGLEVGVGTGRFAEPFNITEGVEPSSAMARIAEKRGVNVAIGTGESLPLSNEVFDFVLVVTTICFFEDALTALKECFRVIRKGGWIVVGFVDRNTPLGETYLRKQEENVFYRNASFYSADEVLSLLAEAGFSNFETVQTVFGRLEDITSEQDFRAGYGEGGFVVIQGNKH